MASFQNRKQSTVPITQKKLTQSILQCQLAFDDLDWAPITSPFSVDSPLTLDLKLKKRATASNSVEVLSTVRESTKVKEKGSRSDASQLASEDLDWAPITSPFSVDSPLTLDLGLEALRSKTSKTFFQLEKKRHRQFFQFLSLTSI